MTFISKLALAAALTAGLTTTAALTPAVAQKKKDKAAEAGGQPPIKLSNEVRGPLSAAQTAIAANDNATAETQLAAAEAAAKTDDERYMVNAIRLSMAAKANDRAKLAPLLDNLIANPKTPPADVAKYTFFRGNMAFEGKAYAQALPLLTKARDLGYQDPDLNLRIAQAMVETGNVQGGVAEIQKAIDAETAAGRKAPESWYSYAVARLYMSGDRPGTAVWLSKALKAYPTPQNWRKSILVYRDGASGGGTPKPGQTAAKPLARGERIDLFRLMRATKSLADRGDYLEYADDANAAGLPYEAKAVIQEGRATGKLPAGDPNGTRVLAEAESKIKIDTPLATLEKQAGSAANGKLAAQTADAHLATGNYAKAIDLYKLALQKGGVDASEVNLRLGMALTQAGQKDAARTAFNGVTTQPRSDMAVFWKEWLDQQGATPAAPAATN